MKESKKTKFYNESDCNTLINYYNNLLKNKIFGDTLKIRVIKVFSIEYPKFKYRIRVNAYVVNQNNCELLHDIDNFCEDNDIPNPKQILANQN